MTRFRRIHLAPDTVLGLLALVVAAAWAFSNVQSMDDGAADAAIAGAPAPNVKYVFGATRTYDGPRISIGFVDCPKGQTAVAGGYWLNNSGVRVVRSRWTDELDGWEVAISNQPPFPRQEVDWIPYAVCAKPGVPLILPKPKP